MKRKLLVFSVIFLVLVLINVAFINNLRNLPYANYYVLLLAINIDLIALILISAVILRKLIKVYLGKRRNLLRRKLANILFLYLFIPLLILNVASIVVVLQSTKTYLSSKTRALSSSAESVYRNLYSYELQRIKRYRDVVSALIKAGLFEELSRMEEVESVVRVPECNFEVSEGEMSYVLCIDVGGDHYRVVLPKDLKLIRDVSEFGELALDLRAFVKTRDIITGVFIFFIVFISLVTLLATVWLAMLVARHISEPIERLSDRAMRIAKGNLDVEIEETKTGDEIEELSRAFRKMKDNLREIYEELRRERDLLGKLLDSLPVGVVYSRSGKVVRENRAAREMFGEAERVEEILEKVEGDPNLRVERIEAEEGDIYLFEDVGSIVLAERFRTWQEAVKRIAHEIKNPLTPIRLNLERIRRYSEKGEIDRDRLRDLISMVLREIDRISDLINQFKHLSADRRINLRDVRMSEIIGEIAKFYSSAGIKVSVEGDRTVKGDPTLLRDLFYNLINNSLENGAKEVRIEIDDSRLDYRDNGEGIREEDLETIFIPYYTNNPKGMGIGMAVVKKIAEDHGWEIRALSSKRGAHFVIDFRSRNSRA